MRWSWLIFGLLTLAACADDDEERVTPLLKVEAGPQEPGDASIVADVGRSGGIGARVSGTFTVYTLDGRLATGLTAVLEELESETDAQGRVRFAVQGGHPFLIGLLPDGPPHWSEGIAPTGPFSHGVLVLDDAAIARLFSALPSPPRDGSGVLVVEAPVGAEVNAGGVPGVLWGLEGPVPGAVVPSEGPRLVIFPDLPAGTVPVVVRDQRGEACHPLPAGAGDLAPRVRAGGITHVAFRCP